MQTDIVIALKDHLKETDGERIAFVKGDRDYVLYLAIFKKM